MPIRPFKLLNASERAWLARGVRGDVTGWFAAWLPALEAGEIRCFDAADRAHDTPARDAQRWIGCAEADASIAVAVDESAQWLAEALLGEGTRGALSADVAVAALRDLGKRLLGAARPAIEPELTEHAPGAECWRRGFGAALFEVGAGARSIVAVASPAWVADRLAGRPRPARSARPALVDPKLCVGHAGVGLRVWAGSATIEIGLLQTLVPGDVIRLDSRIDQPLRVGIEGHETQQRAWIGRTGERRAVRFAAGR